MNNGPNINQQRDAWIERLMTTQLSLKQATVLLDVINARDTEYKKLLDAGYSSKQAEALIRCLDMRNAP
jgi:hypothetical protein